MDAPHFLYPDSAETLIHHLQHHTPGGLAKALLGNLPFVDDVHNKPSKHMFTRRAPVLISLLRFIHLRAQIDAVDCTCLQ